MWKYLGNDYSRGGMVFGMVSICYSGLCCLPPSLFLLGMHLEAAFRPIAAK